MAGPPRFQFTASASLLHNNLACSSVGLIACVHNSISSATGGKLMFHDGITGEVRDGPEVTQVTSFRFLGLSYGTVLCVNSCSGTQIFSEDGFNMLFFLPLADNSATTDAVKHHQGSCVDSLMQHIVCGTSNGALAVIQSPSVGAFTPNMEMPPSSVAEGIADVCYNALGNNIVSVHHNGDLRFWVLSGHQYADTGAFPGNPSPVRILTLGTRILVASSPGTVSIRDAMTANIQAEISAHARNLTAMTTREEACQVLTVGEDTILNVWQIEPTSGQVAIASTQVVADKLLTGACLHPAGGAAVAAYDAAYIYHVGI